MLQWMGGSRRKVTTSRKSVQKRQKQYFEQRRRQQHRQTDQLESSEGEGKVLEQTNRDYRSLDILNLLNLSTTCNEEKPACPTGREDPKSNVSTVKYHAITDPQMLQASKVGAVDSPETNQASSIPRCQVKTLSPKKSSYESPDECRKKYNKINDNPDCLRTESQQQLSLYDLLGDDKTNEKFEEAVALESHVAFSVDGLGNVGTETPPASPRNSDRFISYGCFSPSKAAKQINSSRNHSSVLNGCKHQMDAIIQDVEMPLRGSHLDFVTGMEDSYRKGRKNFSTLRDCMQLDSMGRKVRSPSFDGKVSFYAGDNHEDLWDGISSFADTDFLGEKKCDMDWKRRPRHPDASLPDFLELRNDEMPDYAFDSVNLLQKDASKATERFNFLDSFSPRHQNSDHGYDFVTHRGASWHHFVDTSFDFGDVSEHPDCSGVLLEDARESLSLLSEESCSSKAVRKKITDVSLTSSRKRGNRRHHTDDFAGLQTSHDEKIILAHEKHSKHKDDILKAENACWTGNFSETPVFLDSKSDHNLNFLSEKRMGPHGNWLLERGHGAADTDFGLGHECPSLERNRASAGSRALTKDIFHSSIPEPNIAANFFTKDIFHSSIPEPNIAANFSFGEHGVFSKSPSGSCISEKRTSCQPGSQRHFHNSPSLSKAECCTRKLDFSPKSMDSGLESSFTHSSQNAFCHGGTLSDSTDHGSVSKSNESQPETPKVEDEQIKPVKEILIERNTEGISIPNSRESKESKVLTLLPAKISDYSESSVKGIEHLPDDDVRVCCETENKVHLNTEKEGERKIENERQNNCPNSSPQLMMLESFVLKFLCVQKVSEAACEPTQERRDILR